MSIRWGILGAGDIARKQTAAAIQGAASASLYAVMRRTREGAEKFACEYGAAVAYDSVDDLLADPNVDAVYVATPVHAHCQQTIDAARAGKHVLVEKPMAMSASQCEQMITVCKAEGVGLFVCYYQRFNLRHQKVRELVQDGALGQVTMAQARQCFYYPQQESEWRQSLSLSGGGAIMDVGVHCINTLRYILGGVSSVTALVDTLAFEYEVDDTATLLLQFESGAQVVVSVAFSIPEVGIESLNFLEVSGTLGRVWTSPLHSKDSKGDLLLYTGQECERFQYEQRTHVRLIEEVGQSILNDIPTTISGTEGLRDMKVIEAAYESARTGRSVVL